MRPVVWVHDALDLSTWESEAELFFLMNELYQSRNKAGEAEARTWSERALLSRRMPDSAGRARRTKRGRTVSQQRATCLGATPEGKG